MHETKMEAAAPGELAGRQRTEEREQDVFFRREGLKQQPFGHEGIAAVRGAVADGVMCYPIPPAPFAGSGRSSLGFCLCFAPNSSYFHTNLTRGHRVLTLREPT